MRPLVPMPFPTGPCFLKMHPKLSTTVFIASRSGQFHVCDIGNTSDIHFYQVFFIFFFKKKGSESNVVRILR